MVLRSVLIEQVARGVQDDLLVMNDAVAEAAPAIHVLLHLTLAF